MPAVLSDLNGHNGLTDESKAMLAAARKQYYPAGMAERRADTTTTHKDEAI